MKIIDIKSREILDSRGYPTIETDVILENGFMGRASIPSGKSIGLNEAVEIRDGEERFMGQGVRCAVSNVLSIIKPLIINKDIQSLKELDKLLIKIDGTENKSNLGANAILSVSLAFLKALAISNNKELYEFLSDNKKMPQCMFNVINGGKHSSNNLDFQEFMIMANRDSIKEQLEVCGNIFHCLKAILLSKNYSVNVGDEGGFAPNLKNNEEAIDFIIEAIKKANYIPGVDVFICLDVAATSFYDKKTNTYLVNKTKLTREKLISMYQKLVKKYPIYSIEDPFYEEDFEGFSILRKLLPIQIVGDDLFTTNKKLLQKGIDLHAGNAILIKANQIGTISEMLETIKLARENNYNVIISHRSGETEDTFISDLAVGLSISLLKSGSLSRGERICKYNRLIRIEEKLKN